MSDFEDNAMIITDEDMERILKSDNPAEIWWEIMDRYEVRSAETNNFTKLHDALISLFLIICDKLGLIKVVNWVARNLPERKHE